MNTITTDNTVETFVNNAFGIGENAPQIIPAIAPRSNNTAYTVTLALKEHKERGYNAPRAPRMSKADKIKAQRENDAQALPMPMGNTPQSAIVASASASDEIKADNAKKSSGQKPRKGGKTQLKKDTPQNTFFTPRIDTKHDAQQTKEVNSVVMAQKLPDGYGKKKLPAYEVVEVSFDDIGNYVVRAKIVLYMAGRTIETKYVGRARIENNQVIGLSLKNTEEDNYLIALWGMRAYEKRAIGLAKLALNEVDSDGLPLPVKGYNVFLREKFAPLLALFVKNARARKGMDASKVTTTPYNIAGYAPFED